jgi:uncharacterized protein
LADYYDGHPAYLNWDLQQHRDSIKHQQWPKTEKLIVLDEIHKFKNWQSLIKGTMIL